jgi:predicted N-acyltransferase
MFEEKYLQEVAPYKKRGPKNKRITKVKHKHNYVPINITYNGKTYLYVTTQCTICEHKDSSYFRYDPKTFDYDDYLNSIQENVEFFNKLKKERRKSQ